MLEVVWSLSRGIQLTDILMRSEALSWPNHSQGSTWIFTVAPALLRHQINTSDMIGNSVNRSKLSRDDFGVEQISQNKSTVAQSLPFSHQNVENVAYNGAENFTDYGTNDSMDKGDITSIEGRVM